MNVTHVNGKSYKVVPIRVDDPLARCKNCAFNHDIEACIVAGDGCTYDKKQGTAGYFVPEQDEQCGVGNG